MNRFWKFAVGSQLLAIATQTYLTSTHYKLKLGLMDGKSLCNINEYLNCDVVNTSAYSTFLGIPMALWGLFVNGFLFAALLICALTDQRPQWLRISLLTSTLVALTSVVMGTITLLLIKALCLFCLAAYALSFVTYFCVRKIQTDESKVKIADLVKPLGISAFVVLVATFLTHKVTMNGMAGDLDQAVSSSMVEWKGGKDVDLSKAEGLSKGSERSKAKMVIIEFADFQCIHCKQAFLPLKTFVQSHPDVSLTFQSFPLDGQCNKAIERAGPGTTCDFAKAVYCGYKQGKGWQMHDWIYENFGEADLNTMTEYAKSVDMNIEDWRKCRDSPETQDTILAQAKLGETSGVQGTPSIFVNGRLLPRGGFLPVLESAYQELNK